MDDLGELGEAPVAEPAALHERLERAVLSLVTELGAEGVERDRVAGELLRPREEELGRGIHEAPDEPRRGDPVHVGARARHPAPAAKRLERDGALRRRRGAGRMEPHLDRLPEPLDLLPARRVEEVDPAHAPDLPCEPRQLALVPRGAAPARLRLEALGDLAVACGERPVLLLPRLLEAADDLGARHVLDLVHVQQRRLAPALLHFLREPLELLEVLRRERQDVDRLLQRHRPERAELPPHPDPQARRVRGHGHQQDQPRRHRLRRNVTYVT